jgi:hypothetical protein
MKLICYTLHPEPPRIRPAPQERQWMEETPQRYATRCLPLNIANAHGWEVLTPAPFEAWWNGRPEKEAITITSDAPEHQLPISHFGSGVLTWHIPVLFHTDPGVQLFVTGPINRAKAGIAALSGIIETDWAPYSFTMNWRFTDAHRDIIFEADEPFCTLFPIRLDTVLHCEPEFRPIDDDPDFAAAHRAWAESRGGFNKDLKVEGSSARDERWQKKYFRGEMPDGTPAPQPHHTKIRLKPFSRPDG